jgi:hypothetical protein
VKTVVKVALGVLVGGLLVIGAGAALVAFSWSPLRTLVAEEGPAGGGGYRSEPTPPPAGNGQFSGRGSKNLGTIEVPRDSVLSWTTSDDGFGSRLFAVMDRDFKINVSVRGRGRGQSPVKPGVYNEVTVNSVGDWTMTIEPR